MLPCKRNEELIDQFTLGEVGLADLDQGHLEACASCRQALAEARTLRALLQEYDAQLDERADKILERNPARLPGQAAERSPFKQPLPWLAIAASLIIAFLLGWLWKAQSVPEVNLAYFQSLDKQATRLELLTYLGRSQMFLLSLFDGTIDCSETGFDLEQEVARKLVFQKRLLEPKLKDVRFEDLRPILNELETLLLEIANSPDCMPEDLMLWRQVIESRSTLTKLKLLQMENRI